MPHRIQLSRRKGWRKPEGVIVVARPSKWGNPWRIIPVHDPRFAFSDAADVVHDNSGAIVGRFDRWERDARNSAPYWAVQSFRRDLVRGELMITVDDVRRTLAGHDLACWCPLDQPCHADVLLEIASGGDHAPMPDDCPTCGDVCGLREFQPATHSTTREAADTPSAASSDSRWPGRGATDPAHQEDA
ncbi:DUF4326 domain-containing protein [Curtobacterium sp. MCBD17_003]|uniref:DUF4326 domain-containing protein n=1 Tax=Curtobacterium sp. MCBD17_003 TaxID=2175667 RepID=UPI000DA8F797|nr:DUF4326 domain-containing protein [Curtobacterium sp. MCBD17_003]WIE55393.1 DUF4326 domain-containing protein [Curtobacterium sp. MCBD17_003]